MFFNRCRSRIVSWLKIVPVLVGVAVPSVWMSSTANAQYSPNSEGITVEGIGEIRTVPDVVEINLRLVARGELTDDAVVKHRDARKRTLETFEALKLENLELQERDLTLRPGNGQEMMQMMMWGNMPSNQNKRTQIEVGSLLRTRLKNVNKLPVEELMSTIGKLLDAAQDSGAGLGMSDSEMMMMRWYGGGGRQQSLVKFIVTNIEETREKAYELAVADARKRAERLARLSGVKLGSVLSLDEIEGGMGRQQYFYYYMPPDSDDGNQKTELAADTMTGGRLGVRLRVRFSIDGASKATAAKDNSLSVLPVASQENSK